jgi:hypothetical protein
VIVQVPQFRHLPASNRPYFRISEWRDGTTFTVWRGADRTCRVPLVPGDVRATTRRSAQLFLHRGFQRLRMLPALILSKKPFVPLCCRNARPEVQNKVPAPQTAGTGGNVIQALIDVKGERVRKYAWRRNWSSIAELNMLPHYFTFYFC